nr:unnamed protein product [Haemonchus contortus]
MDRLSCSLCGHVMLSYNNYSKHLCCAHGDDGVKIASELVNERKLTAKVSGQHNCKLCNLRSSLKALNKGLNQQTTKSSAPCDKDLLASQNSGSGSTEVESATQDLGLDPAEMKSKSLDSSGDSDSHNSSEKSASRESVSDAIKEDKRKKIRERVEEILGYIRECIDILDKILSYKAKLARQEVEDADDDNDSLDEGSSDEDDDGVFCAKCGDVQPPGNSDVLTDWLRCNDCDAWAHKECLDSRKCMSCGIGISETASSTDSETILGGKKKLVGDLVTVFVL